MPPPRPRAGVNPPPPNRTAPSGRTSWPSSRATSTRPRRATSWPSIGCSTPYIARLTKGATCCCDRPASAGGLADRARRDPARAELPAVPVAPPELLRRHAGGAVAHPPRAGGRARGAPSRLLVRLGGAGAFTVPAGCAPVGLFPPPLPAVRRARTAISPLVAV